jgi:DNA polymerase III epsilon subunit-like protein
MISIVLDTETTGLLLPKGADLEKQPRIIELAFARLEHGKVVSQHEWLIDPECEIGEKITKITGIKQEDLEGKPKFREILADVEEAIAGADVLIAHNAPFDSGMLANELARCARTGFPWPTSVMCTVQEFYHLKGRRLKLGDLYELKLGKKMESAHRAMGDVMALVEILQAERMV